MAEIIKDNAELKLEEIVVRINRVATVVKGGKRFSFSALVAIGNRENIVGYGFGKANEVPNAVEKAIKNAKTRLIKLPLLSGTVPHEVVGNYCNSKVLLLPASAGTGIIAGSSVRNVLELAGIHNVLTKSFGSNTAVNLVKATYDALLQLRDVKEVERLRGVKLDYVTK